MKLSRIIFFFLLLLLLFFSSALSSQPLEPTFSSFTLFPSRSLSRLEKRRSSSRRLCISRTNRQPRNVFRRLSTSPLSYRFLFSLFPSSSHCLRFACPFKSERTRAKLCETTEPRKTKSLTFASHFWESRNSRLFCRQYSPYFARFINVFSSVRTTIFALSLRFFPTFLVACNETNTREKLFPREYPSRPLLPYLDDTTALVVRDKSAIRNYRRSRKRNLHDLFLPASRLDEWRNVDSRYPRFEVTYPKRNKLLIPASSPGWNGNVSSIETVDDGTSVERNRISLEEIRIHDEIEIDDLLLRISKEKKRKRMEETSRKSRKREREGGG